MACGLVGIGCRKLPSSFKWNFVKYLIYGEVGAQSVRVPDCPSLCMRGGVSYLRYCWSLIVLEVPNIFANENVGVVPNSCLNVVPRGMWW